jgi:DNA ligase (NAD+)
VRTGKEKEFEIPETCPACNNPVHKAPGEVAWYCVNAACPAQLVRNIEYFVSRSAMDIVGMGIKIVEQLVDKGLLKDVADIYQLKVDDLIGLEGFARKKAENLIESIENSKTRPLSRVITALGIKGVGEVMANELAKKYSNLDELSKTTIDELLQIEGIGPNIASQIVDWFNQDRNKLILEKLKNAGVWPVLKRKEVVSHEDLPLSGKVIVVTGTLKNFSRNEIKDFIEEKGGKTSSSVSKNTSFVLVGENPGSKFDKAKELGVTVLNEEEFLRMVRTNE